jgi:hypothetical protein
MISLNFFVKISVFQFVTIDMFQYGHKTYTKYTASVILFVSLTPSLSLGAVFIPVLIIFSYRQGVNENLFLF